ncbi:MAG: hypothetical protein COZ38_08360 [Rhodocyclales bacterium CG_4_10_14_3_um_filter_68_10]|nr:MAG: hypothetical protein COZ38_08360 [Rhodocyclales bacterium CG_4_10_14_3_um_filter_68_10]
MLDEQASVADALENEHGVDGVALADFLQLGAVRQDCTRAFARHIDPAEEGVGERRRPRICGPHGRCSRRWHGHAERRAPGLAGQALGVEAGEQFRRERTGGRRAEMCGSCAVRDPGAPWRLAGYPPSGEHRQRQCAPQYDVARFHPCTDAAA